VVAWVDLLKQAKDSLYNLWCTRGALRHCRFLLHGTFEHLFRILLRNDVSHTCFCVHQVISDGYQLAQRADSWMGLLECLTGNQLWNYESFCNEAESVEMLYEEFVA
jgi:hypothetical protein